MGNTDVTLFTRRQSSRLTAFAGKEKKSEMLGARMTAMNLQWSGHFKHPARFFQVGEV